MNVTNEIQTRLEQFVSRELALVDELSQLKRQQRDVKADISKAVMAEGMAALAAEVFESSRAGSYGRKITKSLLDQTQKDQRIIAERNIESRHNITVQEVRNFLSSISVKKKRLREPNSSELIAKVDKAQDFVRTDTRIRRSIYVLRSLLTKQLIYNNDIPIQPQEVIIPPGKPFTGSTKLKEILRSLHGYTKILDPYVDEKTLELLLDVPERLPIKILTVHTGGRDKEKRFLKACRTFKEERPQFEVKKCDKTLVHDRFILDRNQGWNIGSSLKDIGKRMSTIKAISSESKVQVERIFDEI